MTAPDPRLPTSPDTLTIYSDLNCSFAHLAVHRLHETRTRLGLDGLLWFDHRSFPLELFNKTVNEHLGVQSEIAAVGPLEPNAGWQLLTGPQWTYPVTMLPPLEAVQATKSQSLHASEQLDRALRRAFWSKGRCISMRHEILAVAKETGAVDVPALAAALDSGSARGSVMAHYHTAHTARYCVVRMCFCMMGRVSRIPVFACTGRMGRSGWGFRLSMLMTPGFTLIFWRARRSWLLGLRDWVLYCGGAWCRISGC